MERTFFRKKLEGFHTIEVDKDRVAQGSDLEIILKYKQKTPRARKAC
jgi:hypothetical protein